MTKDAEKEGQLRVAVSFANGFIDEGKFEEAILSIDRSLKFIEFNIDLFALRAYSYLQLALKATIGSDENLTPALQDASRVIKSYDSHKSDNDFIAKLNLQSIAKAYYVDGMARLKLWGDKESALKQYKRLLNLSSELSKELYANIYPK